MSVPNFNPAKGEEHYEARLTVEAVVALRREYAAAGSWAARGTVARRFAERYGVSPNTARCAAKRRSWKHVP